jgi:molybdopterin-guanine dinucleotide biosynthesis protein A
MLGVILCGGDSTRMGRDKGLIPADTQTWAGSAAKKMTALGIHVALSVSDRQLPHYAQELPNERLISDDPTLTLKGPLAGLLSVHNKYPSEDLFVLACDLPLIDTALLHDLCRRQSINNGAQAYIYTAAGEPEPLCGIYTASGLALITGLYQAQRLARHSMKYALEQLLVDSQPIPKEKIKCFENFNYPRASGS